MEQLKKYDVDGNCELYDTIVCYVKYDCNINRTAEELLLHKNTVRYRIAKAREILGMEECEGEFHAVIFLTVHFQMVF